MKNDCTRHCFRLLLLCILYIVLQPPAGACAETKSIQRIMVRETNGSSHQVNRSVAAVQNSIPLLFEDKNRSTLPGLVAGPERLVGLIAGMACSHNSCHYIRGALWEIHI